MKMSYITCKNVSFAYENQIVVSGLDFQVNAGDYLCIIGENGTGKTTLIKGLLGLKKPAGGDFPASVYEVVLSVCLNSRGMKPGFGAADKKRAVDNMELLKIGDLKNKSFQDLSGGQRQRVLLARSLCATKRLLLLDEPITGLDPVATEEFYAMLDDLNGNHDITIIMVSHDIREAVEHADHILHLSHGGYFFGTTQDYGKSGFGKKFLGGLADA